VFQRVSKGRCQTMLFLASLYLALGCLASPVSFAEAPAGSTDRDPYGGWNHLQFESTGFFHVSERDGVWWLVTPQGHAFLSKGINNVSFRADDAPTLGYSPYQRAVQNKYGSQDAWAEAVVDRLRGWGFNTLGSWSSPSTFDQTDSVLHDVIPVAFEEPPVGQAFALERQTIIRTRDTLHPVDLPLEIDLLRTIMPPYQGVFTGRSEVSRRSDPCLPSAPRSYRC